MNLEQMVCRYAGVPACTVNSAGIVTAASCTISDVFVYDKITGTNIFTLTAIKYCELRAACEEDAPQLPYLNRNDRVFKLKVSLLPDEETVAVYFNDRTDFENLKERYNDERPCMAIIHVDNHDEIKAQTPKDDQLRLETDIDRCIRRWGGKIDASITKYNEHKYFFVFEHKYYEWIKQDKFSLLDNVREIETSTDFPITLSIGIGIQGRTFRKNDDNAVDALDLALGRGGDQAVVKRGEKFEYYGGRTETVGKNNKGKSRIIYYAYKALAEQSPNVFIMGHRNPDMDCLGSALGMHRLTKKMAKDIYIVLNDYNAALCDAVTKAKECGEYNFISTERAMSLMKEESLVVLLDTHRLQLAAAPELVEAAEKLVLIDHHRRSEDAIDKARLTYMEPYASSTSELVTEMLLYADAKKCISSLEAEALLGGISIDTNRFAVQTGVRTFEAATWLRRAGADTASVKKMFRTDEDTFKVRSQAMASAVIEDGIATAVSLIPNTEASIIDSQVADELLTVKGVNASFVAGIDITGRTVISARSLGEINVQLIMEHFGGGGHHTTAGAQSELTPEEVIVKIREILKDEDR